MPNKIKLIFTDGETYERIGIDPEDVFKAYREDPTCKSRSSSEINFYEIEEDNDNTEAE